MDVSDVPSTAAAAAASSSDNGWSGYDGHDLQKKARRNRAGRLGESYSCQSPLVGRTPQRVPGQHNMPAALPERPAVRRSASVECLNI